MNTQKLKELMQQIHSATKGCFPILSPGDFAAVSAYIRELERERDELRKQFDKLASAAGWSKEECDQTGGSPFDVVEDLVSAKRERDELRAEQAEHDEQIARMEGKISLAKRALDSKTARCDRAEAELRRRDAAAGEPVHFYREHNPSNGMKTEWVEVDSEQLAMLRESTDPNTAEFRSLYTSAQPAVLPPPLDNWHISASGVMASLQFKGDEMSFTAGANWMRQHCLEMGAQQQKVVELHKRKSTEVISGQRYSYVLLEDLLPELDAANVKWEVKK